MENKQIAAFGLRALSTDRLTKVTLMSGCLLKRASSKSLTKKCSDAILHLPHYSRSKQYFRTDLDILPAPIIPTLAKWLLVTAGICCSCPESPDITSKTSTRVFGSTVCLLVWTMNYTKQKIAPSCMDLACCFSEVLHWPQQKRGFSGENPSPHEVSMVRAH